MEFLAEFSQYGYLGLFFVSFLAGSIVPFSSEAVIGLLFAAGYDVWTTITVATLGNWLGGVTCYYLGRLGNIVWIERYLRIKHDKLVNMQHFLQGKGALMAFFAFLPIVGGLIVVALGLMRANILWVNLSMLLGKLGRYVVMAYGIDYILALFS